MIYRGRYVILDTQDLSCKHLVGSNFRVEVAGYENMQGFSEVVGHVEGEEEQIRLRAKLMLVRDPPCTCSLHPFPHQRTGHCTKDENAAS